MSLQQEVGSSENQLLIQLLDFTCVHVLVLCMCFSAWPQLQQLILIVGLNWHLFGTTVMLGLWGSNP